MTIALTAFKEKLHRKELYIVSIIGALIAVLFGSGTGQITIGGIAVTDYKMLAPIILIVVNAVCSILSVIMSLNTIPNEYERRTSHLVWIRKISQARYHGELAAANILSGLASEFILFAAVMVFMIIHGHIGEFARLIPAFLIISVNVAFVCVMTSALTVFLPKVIAGFIAAFITLVGIFHDLLMLLKDILSGFAGSLIKGILTIFPNLNAIQAQAGNVLRGSAFDIHPVLTGLLAIYVFAIVIMLVKRKEA